MLTAIGVLLACQLAGEISAQLLAIPVPGPVIGMILLLLVLHTVPGSADSLSPTCNGILRHLSLLFVPAGVGVMLHLPAMKTQWLAITVSLLLGTVMTLAVTALVTKLAMRLARIQSRNGDESG